MDADGCRCIHLILYSTCERADGCRCIHLTYVPDGCLVLCCQLSSSSPPRHESGAAGAEVARSRASPVASERGGADAQGSPGRVLGSQCRGQGHRPCIEGSAAARSSRLRCISIGHVTCIRMGKLVGAGHRAVSRVHGASLEAMCMWCSRRHKLF